MTKAIEFSFTGELAAVLFSNPANFYKVLLLEIDATDSEYMDSEIVLTGTIGEVVEGEVYTFFGKLIIHPKYGEQLVVSTYEKAKPTSSAGLVKYLSSAHFKGIGKQTAEKIVACYPERTIDAILEEPELLSGILSPAKRSQFLSDLTKNHGAEKLLSQLSSYGLPTKINLQIYEKYGEESLNILQKDPYQLMEEIDGIGFKLVDRMATEIGIKPDASGRLRAGLLHILRNQPFVTGDTYLEQAQLLNLTETLLQKPGEKRLSEELLNPQIEILIETHKMVKFDGKYFEPTLHAAEEAITLGIKRLSQRTLKTAAPSKNKIEKAIAKAEKKLGIVYDSQQKEAIFASLENQFSLLTGGPGTGKTTIVQGIIEVFAALHEIDLDVTKYTNQLFPILLAAPTGRAARRMTQITGLPAATLHRHLGITAEDTNEAVANDLSGELLIVDEFSMVDTWLAAKLFSAIPSQMRVLFVGDADQLPSVGPGQVFSDLFSLPETFFAKRRLSKIYRQSESSTIRDLAREIKEGQLPSNLTEKKADRSFFKANSRQIPELITKIAESWLARGNSPFEFQVLAPMYKGEAGIDQLNKSLQDVFNPKEGGLLAFQYQETQYRAGDKILHLINDAETNVFNGDLGKIIELISAKHAESKQDELMLDFDGTVVNYPRSEWYKIRLAYAMSIHKAQGSEFQTVILPLVHQFERMLQRNLLYTAVTRARDSLILLGEVSAFELAAKTEAANRRTLLAQRILGESSPKKAVKFDSEKRDHDFALSQRAIEAKDYDPLIGLETEDFEIFSTRS